ncbi:MAG: hypothetical protein SVM79_02275 [Chloroflexota bacterium]|nr:hypothetical protein [Chloroflexota bacterium]
MMGNFGLVKHHIQSSIRTAIAESHGYDEDADRLRAQGYLRLMIMSDEELRELAQMLSHLPTRPADIVYGELKQVIADQEKDSNEWIGEFGVTPHRAIPRS